MLLLAALCFMAYVGWKRWVWWTPFASFSAALPIVLVQIAITSDWRYRSGIAAYYFVGISINLAFNLALWIAVFWLGRATVRVFRGSPASPKSQSATTAAQPGSNFHPDVQSPQHRESSVQARNETLQKDISNALPALTQRWRYFVESLPFRDDVPLHTRISAFLPLALKYIQRHHAAVAATPSRHVVPLLILTAIAESKTHLVEDVDRAGALIWPFLYER